MGPVEPLSLSLSLSFSLTRRLLLKESGSVEGFILIFAGRHRRFPETKRDSIFDLMLFCHRFVNELRDSAPTRESLVSTTPKKKRQK